MTPFRAHTSDVVALYVVSKLSLRVIGDRYGVSHEAVRLLLLDEGVEIRGRASSVALAQKARAGIPQPRAARVAVVTEADMDRADRKHVSAVIQALCGRGFPFLSLARLA